MPVPERSQGERTLAALGHAMQGVAHDQALADRLRIERERRPDPGILGFSADATDISSPKK